MMRFVSIYMILVSMALATPAKSWHLAWAQHYAQQKQYSRALMHYEQIESKDDSILYNIANLLYHQKQYQKAISTYTQITLPTLMHQKYHNIANCLIRLGEIETAIMFYQNALKFSKNTNTVFNLKLAKSILEKQKEEEKKRRMQESNETLAFRDGSNKIDRFKEDNGTSDLKDAKVPSQITKTINSSRDAQSRQVGKLDIKYSKETNTSIREQDQNIIDNYQAQTWKSYFDKRPLKTLLIPLETSGESNDQNPY